MKSIFQKKAALHHHDPHCSCGQTHHDHHRSGTHCAEGHHQNHGSEPHVHEHDCDPCSCVHENHLHSDAHREEDSGEPADEDHSHPHVHKECAHEQGNCECGCDHHTHHAHSDNRSSETPSGSRRHTDTASSARTEQKVYLLENLGCAHCASKMEDKIRRLSGVEDATITYTTKQLHITARDCDALLPEIRKICTSIESQVVIALPQQRNTAAASANAERQNSAKLKKLKISHDTWELSSIIAGALLFAVGALANQLGLSENVTIALSVISYIILGGSVILQALRNLFKGQIFDENFLMSIATLGAFIISEYLEAVGVMLFYRIGEYFEHKAVERSRSQIMDAVDLRPETVSLITADGSKTIAAETAQAGDILLIRPGDRIPLDGVILEGESRLDTSPITGEPVPVGVKPGDSVISGCVNTSGQLKIRAEKPLSESMVSRILDSVENAAASKPKIDRFITRFSKIYTPCVVIGALLLAIIPSFITGNWNYWIYTALTFLVMSCPCALVLSVPLAFFSGIGAGGKRGILFKGGVSIEALGTLKAVIMDKTGTITEGNFKLQKIIPANDFSEDTLLTLCAGCEQNSSHPIAISIVNAAREKGFLIPAPDVLEEIAGYGIAAQINGKQILCGNRSLMNQYGIALPHTKEPLGETEVFAAVDHIFAGSLIISDTLKADAKDAVSRLKAMGLYTVMLTGDTEDSARNIAAETGIDRFYAKLLPQDKLTVLQKIREEHGSVMFIGDGINDAPVLAGADVGAAMGSGADAAIEAADAVFMNTAVSSIPDALSIAKRTGRIAMQNVVFALGVKAAVMLLGIIGFANMWMAVFADSGVAMLCVLNSIRMLYQNKEKK